MFFLKHYLYRQHLHKPAIHLFLHHFFRLVGTGLLGIFGPIYIYSIFTSIEVVIAYSVVVYGIVTITQPLVMQVINRIGFKISMQLSIGLLMVFFGSLYMMGVTEYASVWLVVAAVLVALVIMMYWVPYHTDFALLTEGRSRGKNLALLTGLIMIMSIITPTVSSWVITYGGFKWLFGSIVILLVISGWYLREIPQIEEEYSLSYWDAYLQMLQPENRKVVLAYIADGMQTIIGGVIWPLFIFFLFENDFVAVGYITSLVVMVSVVIRLVFGEYVDKMSKSKLAKVSSAFHALGWVFKGLVQTPFEVFAAGTYHDLTSSATRISVDSLMYERTAHKGHYADEYSVLREISLSLGRTLILLIALLLVGFVDINALFWLAAVASLFIGLL